LAVTGRRGIAFTAVVILTMMMVLFPQVHASTPIVFDASGSPNPQTCISSCSTLSWSHTVGSGSNRILLVGLSFGGASGSAVTFGGAALTEVGVETDTFSTVELWALQNPASGTATITVTIGFTAPFLVGGSVSYSNVAGIGTSAGNKGTGAAATDLVGTSSGDVVIDTLSAFTVPPVFTVSPTGPGQTQRWNSGSLNGPEGGFFAGAGSDQPASGSSVTMSWSVTEFVFWSVVAVPLIPAPPAPIPEYPFGLPILAILTIIVYSMIRRRSKNPKNI